MDWFEQDKIITPNLSSRNNFTVDFGENDSGQYFFIDHDCYGIILKSKNRNDYLYILGILNSRMRDFYIKQKSPMFSGGYYKYHIQYLQQIPVVESSPEKRSKLIELVKKMLLLNQRLASIGDKKTSETARIEEDLRKTDAEIDALVYGLYGLRDKDIRLLEELLTSVGSY